MSKKIGVAFGGGGMKGWAHVGVISVLKEYGIRPDVISGCSVGAMIGAFYAFGYSVEEMARLMRAQRTSALFAFRFDGLGLLNNDALRDYLRTHLQNCTFADLPVPFYVIATDLQTGREVVIREGSLVDAILASSAMPGIFAPVERDGRLLVDGGLCNNVPVSVLVHHGARYTLAVRLHRDTRDLNEHVFPHKKKPADEKNISIGLWAERLTRTIRRTPSELPNALEVIGRALDIGVGQIERWRLQAYPPDVLIEPEVTHIKTLSFSEEKEEIFLTGVKAAQEKAPLLTEIVRRCQALPVPASEIGPDA
jgi:NTE family protein